MQAGKLTHRDLERALSAQQEMGNLLGRVLVQLGLVSEIDILRTLSEQLQVPLVLADDFPAVPPEVEGLQPDFLVTHLVYPLRLEGDRLDVASGGRRPGQKLDPVMVSAMAAKKIDLAFLAPQGIEAALANGPPDAVVTIGRGAEDPTVPGAVHQDWDLPDPSGQPAEAMDRVRDEIESRVKQLIATLCG